MTSKSTDPVLSLMHRAQRLGFDVVELTYENRPEYIRYDIYTPDGERVLRHTTFDRARNLIDSAATLVYPLEVFVNGSSWPVDAHATVWVDDCMNEHTIARYTDLWGREHSIYHVNTYCRDMLVFDLVREAENADEVLYR